MDTRWNRGYVDGWVMASGAMDHKGAAHKYSIKVVCGVCTGAAGAIYRNQAEEYGSGKYTCLYIAGWLCYEETAWDI